MDNDKVFYILWKGTESGAYSAKDIRDMLNTGKIGYLHLVRTKSSQWIALKDVDLDKLSCEAKIAVKNKEKQSDFFTLSLYIVAGLSFLSAWIFVVSIVLSVLGWNKGERCNALISLVLSAVIAICGLMFFCFVYPTVSE